MEGYFKIKIKFVKSGACGVEREIRAIAFHATRFTLHSTLSNPEV
jgi:hypothetical protein